MVYILNLNFDLLYDALASMHVQLSVALQN
jgi:hypothetical protein